MFIIKHRKIFYILSSLLIGISILSLYRWGLNQSIDFKGGSLLSVSFSQMVPTSDEVQNSLKSLGIADASVRKAGEDSYIIRTQEMTQAQKEAVLQSLSQDGKYVPTEKEFNTIGPVLGSEAIHKAWISIVLVLLAIVLFITFAFRKVSRPVSSWVYGLVAVIALAHDVIIPTGAFSLLGHYFGFEIDTLFVTALLVILGFSVHDTIVVFDRVRENLRKESDHNSKKDFETIVGESVSETFVRSINTSLTTLLAVAVLYFFGPEATKHFAIALLVGITAGTYSSIFIGSPLLVTIQQLRRSSK